jgi:hypothetical protein
MQEKLSQQGKMVLGLKIPQDKPKMKQLQNQLLNNLMIKPSDYY